MLHMSLTEEDTADTFPSLTVSGQVAGGGDWVNVRKTKNWQNNGPVTDVTSRDIRCNELNPGTGATTLNVTAGATVGFAANPNTVSRPPVLGGKRTQVELMGKSTSTTPDPRNCILPKSRQARRPPPSLETGKYMAMHSC